MDEDDNEMIYRKTINDISKKYEVSLEDAYLIYSGKSFGLSPEVQKKINTDSLKSWTASLDIEDRVKLEDILSITHETRDKHNARLEELLTTINESLAKATKPSSKKPRSRRVAGPLTESDLALRGALVAYHGYKDRICTNFTPISCIVLAGQVNLSRNTASLFFKKHFSGYSKYVTICGNSDLLNNAMKIFNGETMSPLILLGLDANKLPAKSTPESELDA